MAIVEATILARIRALSGFSTTAISDADMTLIIAAALDEYSSFRPEIELTTSGTALTTVKDQPNYAMPTGALWIVGVFWHPDISDDESLEDLYFQVENQSFDALHPSELTIIYQRYAYIRKFFQGRYQVIDGEIWLIPTPNVSGNKVAVLFATAATLAAMDLVSDNLFVRLCSGLAQVRRGNDLTSGGGFRAGSYRVDAQVGRAMLTAGQKELDHVRVLLANAYQATSQGARSATPR